MKLGIIGCGNMGKAIVAGAIHTNTISSDNVFIKNYTVESTQSTSNTLKANACATLTELLEKSDAVIIGVKPYAFPELLAEVTHLDLSIKNTLFISIAAGVTMNTLESGLPVGSKIIRTMPNTPTLVGAGMIAFTPNQACNSEDESALKTLLSGSASLTKVPESQMDAVTGLSGSGPAYVYTFIEALADGAVKEGLPRAQALELAAKTVLGGAKMVLETGTHPGVLRDQVTSPGGTTIAGVAALEENGFRNATIKAVEMAVKRSRELS